MKKVSIKQMQRESLFNIAEREKARAKLNEECCAFAWVEHALDMRGVGAGLCPRPQDDKNDGYA